MTRHKARITLIIENLGGPGAVADALTISSGRRITRQAVVGWIMSGDIPRAHWGSIIALARSKKVSGVTTRTVGGE